METNGVKRKKRRTRKYLDDIRKRSRLSTTLDVASKYKDTNKTVKHAKMENNKSITTERLTLKPAMLSRAIKSETITRPQTSAGNLKEKFLVNIPQLTLERSRALSLASSPNGILNQQTPNNNSTSEIESIDNLEEISFHDNSDPDNSSPKSFIIFSPISQAISIKTKANVESLDLVSSASRSSSQHSVDSGTPGYALYTQFMEEMSEHLEELTPGVTQCDVIRKTKIYLQNIYAESCRLESEQNILHCMNNINELMTEKDNKRIENIVENPMEYIKMGILRKHSVLRELNTVTRESWRALEPAAAAAAACSPCRPRSCSPLCSSGHPSPRGARSPQAPSPRSPLSSPPPLSLINDTPEYTFFPRKLNQ